MRTQRRLSVSDFRYSPLVAALAVALAPGAGHATTKKVTSNADQIDLVTQPNTLREAIEYFNTTDIFGNHINCVSAGGLDTINFDFSNGPFTIALSSDLPAIACPLTIEGANLGQTTASTAGQRIGITTLDPVEGARIGLQTFGRTQVKVNDLDIFGFLSAPVSAAPSGTALQGLFIANNVNLSGNAFGFVNNGYPRASIANSNVETTNQSSTTGIYISYGGSFAPTSAIANVTGNTVRGFTHGVYLDHTKATVSGNTLAGNTIGLYIEEDQGSDITGNFIGTTSDGSVADGNSTGVVFGSTSAALSKGTRLVGNTISGNGQSGIDLSDFEDIHIIGNFIGTNSSDAAGLGNGGDGLDASCGVGLEVRNNVISGNGRSFLGNHAIDLRGVQAGVSGAVIAGNKIGVKGDGVTALSNNAYGIWLGAASRCGPVSDIILPPTPTQDVVLQGNKIGFNAGGGVEVQASNITFDGNTIFSNAGYGIEIQSGVGNAMVDNLIYANAGSAGAGTAQKNINLDFSGDSRPNDSMDVDTAPTPNNGQNYPESVAVTRDFAGGRSLVSFVLDSQPGTYRVDVYANNPATMVPGGNSIVATTSVTIAAAGPTPGSAIVSSLTADYFSLLATRMSGSTPVETSEFSPVTKVVTTPAATVSPSTLDFGSVTVNSDSPARHVTVSSTGSAPYRLDQLRDTSCYGGTICATGAFTCSTTCSSGNYAPGASCDIQATFHPPALGTFSKTLALCGNDGVHNITLTGTGTSPPPIILSPSSFDFGSALVGTRTAPTSFIVFNPGEAAATLGPVQGTLDFAIVSNDCKTTLDAKQRCNVGVTFVPTRPGLITGSLSVTADSVGAPASATKAARAKVASGPAASATLTGTGVVQAILEMPSAIDFGAFTVGSTPLRQTVTLRNNGNAVLTLSNISVTGTFELANGCPLNLGAGESCTLTLTFSDTALGSHSGALTIVSNAVGGSRSIPLGASTNAIPAPRISVAPASIGFGDRLLGTPTTAQRVTIRNEGNAPAILTVTASNTDFLVVNTTCGTTLAPATTCFADVALRPVGFGPRTGDLFVVSNALGSPHVVHLTGTGCRPFAAAANRFGSGANCSP